MSGRWPVPSQMSLVMRMSPSSRPSRGKTSRNARMVRGSVPMKDGILLEGCAMDRPRRSVMTQAKSLDSRTTEENEVRTKAAAASSTIEINRRQINSTVIAFSIQDPFLLAHRCARHDPRRRRRIGRRGLSKSARQSFERSGSYRTSPFLSELKQRRLFIQIRFVVHSMQFGYTPSRRECGPLAEFSSDRSLQGVDDHRHHNSVGENAEHDAALHQPATQSDSVDERAQAVCAQSWTAEPHARGQ